jgi:hypothetical protein
MNEQNTQGSQGWLRARLAKCTASRFGDVLSGPMSASYVSYARQIRFEMTILDSITRGEEIEMPKNFTSVAMEWGKKYEPIARAEYSWQNDVDVIVPPLIIHPVHAFVGASPDGLCGKGGVEIKAPFNERNHAETLLHGMPEKHIPQIQGQIWVAGLEYVDFVSFDPRRTDAGRYHQQRIERDERYIAALEKAVKEFWIFVMSGEEIPKIDGSVPTLF